jgi:hypothetical protein
MVIIHIYIGSGGAEEEETGLEARAMREELQGTAAN